MSKTAQKVFVWSMIAIMVGGLVASLVVYFIN